MNPLSRALFLGSVVTLQILALNAKESDSSVLAFTLPSAEQTKTQISKHIFPLSAWIESQNQRPEEFLCLGEVHDGRYRDIAKKIFSELKIDHLILEANAKEIEKFKSDLEKRQPIKHLGAEFGGVLTAGFKLNPGLTLWGAENTGDQKTDRDVAIAVFTRSILNEYPATNKTVALYGALHCGRQDWGLGNAVPFFQHLERNLKPRKFRNARILIPKYNLEPQLLALLIKLDIKEELIVLRDAKNIDPIFYRYNAELFHLFQNYDDLIIDTRNIRAEN